MTPGGHRRIALADIEAFRNRRGNAETKIGQSSVSSPTLQLRKENLEEMRLMIEERKTKAALRALDDTEHEKAELEEATRRAKEEQARREQSERDSERQKQEQLERRQFWVDEQVEFALKSVPPDVAETFASDIQLSVEEALQGLGASRPRTLVERLVRAAVDRVVEPWRREQQRKQDIAAAANVAADPFRVPGLLVYCPINK